LEEYDNRVATYAAGILSGVAEAAKTARVPCVTQHVKDKFVAEGIIGAAKSHRCDLIVMASHGRRGLSRFLLGNHANKVVKKSTIPVLICR
jgi:nucleotide-binding universal stress UspA family protein